MHVSNFDALVRKVFSLIIILSAFQLSHEGLAQESVTEPEPEQLLSVSDLSSKIEENDIWIKSIEKDIEKSAEIANLYDYLSHGHDSIFATINKNKDEDILKISFQSVEGVKAEINKYELIVTESKNLISSRLDMFQFNLKQLNNRKNEWIEIEKEYREDVTINALLKDRLKPLMDRINKSIAAYEFSQKEEIEQFNELNQISNLINHKMDLLEERENTLRNLILQENTPIWKMEGLTTDSTSLIAKYSKGFNERKSLVIKYAEFHYQLMIVHSILIVLLILVLIYIRSTAIAVFAERKSDLGQFLNNPVAVAYVMSYIFTGSIYDEFPAIILEIILVSLILPVGYILSGYVNRFQRKVLLISLTVFFIYMALELFPLLTPVGRVISLTFQFLVLISLILLRSNISRLILTEIVFKIVKFVIGIFAIVVFIAIVFGVIGSVQLSQLMLRGTIFSIGIGIVLLLLNQILRGFAILFFELPGIRTLEKVVVRRDELEKKAFVIIGIYLIWSFLVGAANQFNVSDILIAWWDRVIGHPYAFGELEVSIQDFINFFVVIFITIMLARFLKYMFGKEILTKFDIERGLPNAISTTIYYFIVVMGFFLAAASTGIEWSKVNLALGAIGVGIGFGLQNIIYNFIAGLILIYERPIQVGDTIEFGKMMGPVTEIGIRSSKVLTYEGAEVIVPNGDLISKEVINWTYTDQLKRRELIIKTTYQADPNAVIDTMKEILSGIENVLVDPAPNAYFTGYGDGTLDFRVLFWTHLDVGLSTGSRAAIALYNGLLAAGYELPMHKSAVIIEQKPSTSY